MNKYIIVKYAGLYDIQSQDDPRIKGATLDESCCFTHTGRSLDLRQMYDTPEDAEKDCKRINEYNPSGYYAVCPLIDEEKVS
jgi:hypothetical protein